MNERRRLPNRRASLHVPLEVSIPGGAPVEGSMSIGIYPDGFPAEVFSDIGKPGSQLELLSRDAACILSIAWQWGVPPEEIARAVTALEDGAPATVIGAMAHQGAELARAARDATDPDQGEVCKNSKTEGE